MSHKTMSPQQRIFTLSPQLDLGIQKALEKRGVTTSETKKIAAAVKKMSDFYIQNPDAQTPWSESWCQIAQLAYYLPLNHLRSVAVATEAKTLGFPLQNQLLIDFGSGLGAGSLSWFENFSTSLQVVEQSSIAFQIHQELFQALAHPPPHLTSEKNIPSSSFSALFSFSLTELKQRPAWIERAEHLVLIEPSTSSDGRKLGELRQTLITKGFSIWGPCPHQDSCPLLVESKTDWCHDRIIPQLPQWMQLLEKELPFKNKTLTMSYLLASRQPAPQKQQWRLIGDSLEEKGKTRQMVCRGSKREFLAWLHKEGKPPLYPRGILIDPPEHFEMKANEIRIKTTDPRQND